MFYLSFVCRGLERLQRRPEMRLGAMRGVLRRGGAILSAETPYKRYIERARPRGVHLKMK